MILEHPLAKMARELELKGKVLCSKCGHPRSEHGEERYFYECDDSRREVCLLCPGYEEPGYPNGKAWHRFRVPEEKV